MIIPTGFTMRDIVPASPRLTAMREWLTANNFDINAVPMNARIEIRDGTCIGCEYYTRNAAGLIVAGPSGDASRHVEWRPMMRKPPEILLAAGTA
jgi:hypothetical protein